MITGISYENIKGTSRSFKGLKRRTLFVGAHRAGKTTLLDAIQLAATGTHLMGPRKVGCIFSGEAIVEIVTSKGGMTYPDNPGKVRLATVGDHLKGGKLVRDSILRGLGADSTSSSKAKPPADFTEDEAAVWASYGSVPIPDLVSSFRRAKASKSSEIGRAESELADLSQATGGGTGAEDIDAANAELASIQETIEGLVKAETKCHETTRSLAARIQRAEFAVKCLKGGTCAFCGSTMEDPDSVRGKMAATISKRMQQKRDAVVEARAIRDRISQLDDQAQAFRAIASRGVEVAVELGVIDDRASRIRNLKRERSTLEQLEEIAVDLANKHIATMKTAAEEAINTTAIKFALELSITGAQWVTDAHGVPFSGMSGVEQSSLVVALLQLGKPQIALLDDSELAGIVGAREMQHTLAALSSCSTPQIFVAMHTERLPSVIDKAWKVVHVDD